MTLTEHLPALQVIVPMLAAPLVVLLTGPGLAWAATAAVSTLTLIIAIEIASMTLGGQTLHYAMGGWEAPIGIVLEIDSFSALVLLVVAGANALAILAGRRSVDSEIEVHRQPMFYAAWLLSLAGLTGMVVSGDAFNIFVFMEISSLAAYILIAGGPNRRALPAVFKYLIMGTAGATFYLIGVGLIYMMTGTLNLLDMADRIGDVEGLRPLFVAAGFITVGLALKAALFPLHVWLPNAYAYAPHMVTAMMAACGTKVAIYVTMRLDFAVFQPSLSGHELQFTLFLMPLALLGIVVASAVAMYEGHIKRLLAFSSVAQIGYILLGASLLTVDGVAASAIHVFNHAIAKLSLFLAVGALAMRYSGLCVDDLAGAGRTMPLTSAAFVLAAFSLIGVPGTAGFISKWMLIGALMNHGTFGLVMVAIVLVSSLMAVVYIWRVVETLYFKPAVDGAPSTPGEAPFALLLFTLVAAALNLVFGIFPQYPVALAEQAATMLVVVGS